MAKFRVLHIPSNFKYPFVVQEDVSFFDGFFGRCWIDMDRYETKEAACDKAKWLADDTSLVVAEYGT